MTELWYWRTKGRIRGPLATEELEAIVDANRLGPGDDVRLDGSDDWVPAAEIRQLFKCPAFGDSPATAAAKLLETAATRRMQGGVATSVRRDNVLSRFAEVISSAASAIAEVLVRASRSAWRWFGRTGRLWITVAGAWPFLHSSSRTSMSGVPATPRANSRSRRSGDRCTRQRERSPMLLEPLSRPESPPGWRQRRPISSRNSAPTRFPEARLVRRVRRPLPGGKCCSPSATCGSISPLPRRCWQRTLKSLWKPP